MTDIDVSAIRSTDEKAPVIPLFSCPCGTPIASAMALVTHVRTCPDAQYDLDH